MKQKFLSLVIICLAFINNSYAQCSEVLNNFEMKLSQSGLNKILVQIRSNEGSMQGSQEINISKNYKLDGLIFAISWPISSNSVEIGSVKTLLSPFQMKIDEQTGTSNKSSFSEDRIVTFYNDVTMPISFSEAWEDKKWYTLAEITYSGTLNKDDFFSFVNCEYGISHPNSYYGNSSTDPWFAILDLNNEYLQFSPKMISERNMSVASEKFSIYPNPTQSDLNIDIESGFATQVAISITDVTGKIIKTIVYKIEQGKNSTTLNLSDIVPGNYFVKITDGKTISYSQKISKL